MPLMKQTINAVPKRLSTERCRARSNQMRVWRPSKQRASTTISSQRSGSFATQHRFTSLSYRIWWHQLVRISYDRIWIMTAFVSRWQRVVCTAQAATLSDIWRSSLVLAIKRSFMFVKAKSGGISSEGKNSSLRLGQYYAKVNFEKRDACYYCVL